MPEASTSLRDLEMPRHGRNFAHVSLLKPEWLFSSDTHVLALRGNEYNGKAENGYYIGQQHEGNTEVKVVRSTERGKDGYMDEVPEGAPGRFAHALR